MSYAIRKDLQGWRAVGSADDVLPYEDYSEEVPTLPAQNIAPQKVTMRQARLALHGAGKLTAVEDAINALPEPPRTAARIEWDFASEVHRSSDFVAMLGAAIGLSEKAMDDLFLAASAL